MNELTFNQIDAVSGGDLLSLSSAAGHLGRAFSTGYAIGTYIVWICSDTSGGSSADTDTSFQAL
ncbi:MAG: hypothetical protein JNM52_00115 [Betaproteobacteria bacterium]|nr:hypothetical protein [Betaproteobacteria bacterium]